ncbi:unnamed protein product, partial [Musa acuminata var. zebrina]
MHYAMNNWRNLALQILLPCIGIQGFGAAIRSPAAASSSPATEAPSHHLPSRHARPAPPSYAAACGRREPGPSETPSRTRGRSEASASSSAPGCTRLHAPSALCGSSGGLRAPGTSETGGCRSCTRTVGPRRRHWACSCRRPRPAASLRMRAAVADYPSPCSPSAALFLLRQGRKLREEESPRKYPLLAWSL